MILVYFAVKNSTVNRNMPENEKDSIKSGRRARQRKFHVISTGSYYPDPERQFGIYDVLGYADSIKKAAGGDVTAKSFARTGRYIAHGIKDGDRNAIREASVVMAYKLNQQIGKDKMTSYLVPVPGHNGKADGSILELTTNISHLTGIDSLPILIGKERESYYEVKKKSLSADIDFGFKVDEKRREIPDGAHFILVDNVLDTGKTLCEARQALVRDLGVSESMVSGLVFASTDRWDVIQGVVFNVDDTPVQMTRTVGSKSLSDIMVQMNHLLANGENWGQDWYDGVARAGVRYIENAKRVSLYPDGHILSYNRQLPREEYMTMYYNRVKEQEAAYAHHGNKNLWYANIAYLEGDEASKITTLLNSPLRDAAFGLARRYDTGVDMPLESHSKSLEAMRYPWENVVDNPDNFITVEDDRYIIDSYEDTVSGAKSVNIIRKVPESIVRDILADKEKELSDGIREYVGDTTEDIRKLYWQTVTERKDKAINDVMEEHKSLNGGNVVLFFQDAPGKEVVVYDDDARLLTETYQKAYTSFEEDGHLHALIVPSGIIDTLSRLLNDGYYVFVVDSNSYNDRTFYIPREAKEITDKLSRYSRSASLINDFKSASNSFAEAYKGLTLKDGEWTKASKNAYDDKRDSLLSVLRRMDFSDLDDLVDANPDFNYYWGIDSFGNDYLGSRIKGEIGEAAREVWRVELQKRQIQTFRDSFQQKLDKQGNVDGEPVKVKYSPFLFADTDKEHGPSTGALYEEGNVITNNGHVLVIEKASYPSANEGKVLDKKGNVIEGAYPNYKLLLDGIARTDKETVTFDYHRLSRFLAGIEKTKVNSHQKDLGEQTVAFKNYDGSIRFVLLRYLESFCIAARHMGMSTVTIPADIDNLISATNERGTVVMTSAAMPDTIDRVDYFFDASDGRKIDEKTGITEESNDESRHDTSVPVEDSGDIYVYALSVPYNVFSQPSEGFLRFNPVDGTFGDVVFDRPLSDIEIRSYALSPVGLTNEEKQSLSDTAGRNEKEQAQPESRQPVSPEPEQTEYVYTLLSRPFGMGAYPTDGFIRYDEGNVRYGRLVYDKPLSFEDTDRYELRPETLMISLVGEQFYSTRPFDYEERFENGIDSPEGRYILVVDSYDDETGEVRALLADGSVNASNHHSEAGYKSYSWKDFFETMRGMGWTMYPGDGSKEVNAYSFIEEEISESSLQTEAKSGDELESSDEDRHSLLEAEIEKCDAEQEIAASRLLDAGIRESDVNTIIEYDNFYRYPETTRRDDVTSESVTTRLDNLLRTYSINMLESLGHEYSLTESTRDQALNFSQIKKDDLGIDSYTEDDYRKALAEYEGNDITIDWDGYDKETRMANLLVDGDKSPLYLRDETPGFYTDTIISYVVYVRPADVLNISDSEFNRNYAELMEYGLEYNSNRGEGRSADEIAGVDVNPEFPFLYFKSVESAVMFRQWMLDNGYEKVVTNQGNVVDYHFQDTPHRVLSGKTLEQLESQIERIRYLYPSGFYPNGLSDRENQLVKRINQAEEIAEEYANNIETNYGSQWMSDESSRDVVIPLSIYANRVLRDDNQYIGQYIEVLHGPLEGEVGRVEYVDTEGSLHVSGLSYNYNDYKGSSLKPLDFSNAFDRHEVTFYHGSAQELEEKLKYQHEKRKAYDSGVFPKTDEVHEDLNYNNYNDMEDNKSEERSRQLFESERLKATYAYGGDYARLIQESPDWRYAYRTLKESGTEETSAMADELLKRVEGKYLLYPELKGIIANLGNDFVWQGSDEHIGDHMRVEVKDSNLILYDADAQNPHYIDLYYLSDSDWQSLSDFATKQSLAGKLYHNVYDGMVYEVKDVAVNTYAGEEAIIELESHNPLSGSADYLSESGNPVNIPLKELIESGEYTEISRKDAMSYTNNVKPMFSDIPKEPEVSNPYGVEEASGNVKGKEGNSESLDDTVSTLGDAIVSYFHASAEGRVTGKPMPIGVLTKEGKAYLETFSGLKMKDNVDFVLNPSDCKHIINGHFGDNEKDKGNNIPLTDDDLRKTVSILRRPDELIFGTDKRTGNNLFFFLKKNDNGTYNLAEVYGDRKGNLTARSLYNTKKGISRRENELLNSSSLTTPKASGASLSSVAKIPIIFDTAKYSRGNYQDIGVFFQGDSVKEDLILGERNTSAFKEASQRNAVAHEDSNVQTDVVGEARHIVESQGIPMEEAEKIAKQKFDDQSHREYHEQLDKETLTQKNKAMEDKEKELKKKEDEQKKNEVQKKEQQQAMKKDGTRQVSLEAAHAALILGSLAYAKEHGGVFINPHGKTQPKYVTERGATMTGYEQLLMSMYSDQNDYRTNAYALSYADAKKDNMPVKQGEQPLQLSRVHWYYQEKGYTPSEEATRKEISQHRISAKEYKALPDAEKGKYVRGKENIIMGIFNADQTAMPSKKFRHDDYIKLLNTDGVTTENVTQFDHNAVLKRNKDLEQKFGKSVVFFKTGNVLSAYSDSARALVKNAGMVAAETKIDGFKAKVVTVSEQSMPKVMESISKGGWGAVIMDIDKDIAVHVRRPVDGQKVFLSAQDTGNKVSRQAGFKMEREMKDRSTHYDEKTDTLTFGGVSDRKPSLDLSHDVNKANGIFRSIVDAEMSSKRLATADALRMPDDDKEKYVSLVRDLSAGVLMGRLGLPAKLSGKTMKNVDFYQRELTGNPDKVKLLAEHVNKNIETITKQEQGISVNYDEARGFKLPESRSNAKPYAVLSYINAKPNSDTREMVLVVDRASRHADVILPDGASLETEKGMRKDRLENALSKQGINTVSLYNAGGETGLKQQNSYFEGKEVSVIKLNQYAITTVNDESENVKNLIAQSQGPKLKPVDLTNGVDGGRAFVVQAEGQKTMFVTPDKDNKDVIKYLTTMKKSNNYSEGQKQSLRMSLAEKYYDIGIHDPSRHAANIVPKPDKEADLSRMERPNLWKSEVKDDKGQSILDDKGRKQYQYFAIANIDDRFTKVDISANPNLFHNMRYFSGEDRDNYKAAVAGKAFEKQLLVGSHQKQALGADEDKSARKSDDKGLDISSTTGSVVDADGNGIVDDQENLAAARKESQEAETVSRGFHR